MIGNMSGMTFVHINIRSLWPKLTNLRMMLGKIDFLGITETWLNQNFPDDMLDIPGFTFFVMTEELIKDVEAWLFTSNLLYQISVAQNRI